MRSPDTNAHRNVVVDDRALVLENNVSSIIFLRIYYFQFSRILGAESQLERFHNVWGGASCVLAVNKI